MATSPRVPDLRAGDLSALRAAIESGCADPAHARFQQRPAAR